jgi:hypothetical protein
VKLVYTNENRLFVWNAKNILESRGFDIFVKNEYASGAMGETSPFDTWLELWVVDDAQYDRACEVLDNALSSPGDAPWRCCQCGEDNDAAFELCWRCGTPPETI